MAFGALGIFITKKMGKSASPDLEDSYTKKGRSIPGLVQVLESGAQAGPVLELGEPATLQ